MVAGCEMSVSTPPRLSPSEHRWTPFSSRSAAAREARSNEISAPKPLDCRLCTSWPGCSGNPGQNTFFTFSWPRRNSATTRPFSSWRGMRRASVLVPRSTSQESKGERMAPAALW
jgi:hypothetical protein